RGIFMEQFDQSFHTEAYVQADTAYYYTIKKLWHLIGNVRVKTVDGLRFNSEELYWDQNRHELYSYCFSRVITPERELQGTYFTSDERMQHYTVSNSVGSFQKDDADNNKDKNNTKTDTMASDSTPKRAPIVPRMR
ncbi:MAG: LPS export ABC transporter periplasmic protein LptC, partial [Prevotella sp.]|nr:LPS export ABC transporter periplasmic protein LptC [Prevotella sp.]